MNKIYHIRIHEKTGLSYYEKEIGYEKLKELISADLVKIGMYQDEYEDFEYELFKEKSEEREKKLKRILDYD